MTPARDLTVVVPTYDEAENLPRLVPAIFAELSDVRILVVDDGSPDGTGAIADELARQDDRVSVLHRAKKEGLAAAYVAGFEAALRDPTTQYVAQMDADLSHDPASLPLLVESVRGGTCDFAIGSRYVRGGGTRNWGVLRQLVSRGGSFYSRSVLGIGVADLTSGFKCWRRSVLEAIDLHQLAARGFGFQIEMTYRAVRHGFRCQEVPITFTDRRAGASKMSREIFFEALGLVWKLRLDRKR